MTEPLQELLKRCRDGDHGAIGELVRRFQPWAAQYAASIIGDDDLGEDAAQEAFLVALERLADLRNPEAFPAWLRMVVRTQAYRIARTRREAPWPEEDEIPSAAPSAKTRLEREELRRTVREAVGTLPPKSREAVEMFYLDERSCSEISDALQIPDGTVRRRLHDARKRLREALLGYIDDAPEKPEKPRTRDLPF